MDYRKLLKKYIAHVESCEGVYYLDSYQRHVSDVGFLDDEWDELMTLGDEHEAEQEQAEEQDNNATIEALPVGAKYPKMPWLEKYITGTGQAMLVHVRNEDCDGGCVIHNPTDPHKDWPTHWRWDTAVMERMCPHGVGHPDRDHLAFVRSKNPAKADEQAVHGCDGCCAVKHSWEAP